MEPESFPTRTGRRTERLLERRRSKRRRRLVLLAVILAVGLLVVPVARLVGSANLPALKLPRLRSPLSGLRAPERASKPAPQKASAERKNRFHRSGQAITLLVIGAQRNQTTAQPQAQPQPQAQSQAQPEVEPQPQNPALTLPGGSPAKGLLVLRLDLGAKYINALQVPDKTYVLVPGLGFETVGQSYRGGVQGTRLAVQNLLGVGIDHFIEMPWSDFDRMVLDVRLGMAFERMVATSLREDKRFAYGRLVSGIGREKTELIPLPVRAVVVGSESFYEPKRDAVSQLVKVIWGVERSLTRSARVIVLNGSGVPAVAAKVADKLARAGYTVVESKNASRFDYKQTEILIYKGDTQRAKDIRNTLGVGVIINRSMPQDIADFAVVVGADYRPE